MAYSSAKRTTVQSGIDKDNQEETERKEKQVIASSKNYEYDIALSYAGEDREYAEALANALKQCGVKVFYDRYEKTTLWGKNLYDYLSDLYQNKAHYCVMFLSKHYAFKVWTNHEREAAQARALSENKEYILPLRLDDTQIPGLLSTISYLNWNKESVKSIVDALMEKLRRTSYLLEKDSAIKIEILGERYEVQELIGRGGMATIYRAQDLNKKDRVVAIKVLREVYSTDPKFVQRFQREAKAASSLQHPNIVQVYDYGQTDGNYFIVMELVEGTDLRRYLRSRGVLDVDRAIIIAHDVALGLGAAHRRGIVHRDVKPQNVLVGRYGSIKLTDFGIASVYKDIYTERLTGLGTNLGNVDYSAPEQVVGEIVSPAADVYSLGIVMYEMLTGRTPFASDMPITVALRHIQESPIPPTQLNPNIPLAMEEIILRCLEKVPKMRFPNGYALAHALETFALEALGDLKSS